DHLQRWPAVEEAVDLVRRQQARRRMLGEVAPFPLAAQTVHHDGLESAAHQGSLQVRADEAGAARDQDHGARYTGRGESAEGAEPDAGDRYRWLNGRASSTIWPVSPAVPFRRSPVCARRSRHWPARASTKRFAHSTW